MLPLRVIIDDPHGTRSFLSVLFVCDHFVQNGCTFLGVSSPIEPYKRDFVLSPLSHGVAGSGPRGGDLFHA